MFEFWPLLPLFYRFPYARFNVFIVDIAEARQIEDERNQFRSRACDVISRLIIRSGVQQRSMIVPPTTPATPIPQTLSTAATLASTITQPLSTVAIAAYQVSAPPTTPPATVTSPTEAIAARATSPPPDETPPTITSVSPRRQAATAPAKPAATLATSSPLITTPRATQPTPAAAIPLTPLQRLPQPAKTPTPAILPTAKPATPVSTASADPDICASCSRTTNRGYVICRFCEHNICRVCSRTELDRKLFEKYVAGEEMFFCDQAECSAVRPKRGSRAKRRIEKLST